ncbi:MAG TPA: hypothetical protein PKM88_04510 [bacterium]|nr:hypothetical protein [bacterium]
MADLDLVVKSKVKEFVNGAEMSCSGEAVEALSGKVADLLTAAIARAKENGRKTVKACDL